MQGETSQNKLQAARQENEMLKPCQVNGTRLFLSFFSLYSSVDFFPEIKASLFPNRHKPQTRLNDVSNLAGTSVKIKIWVSKLTSQVEAGRGNNGL